MFCTKCGHKVENGTSFCGYCGADLTQEASVPRQGEQQAPAANEPVPQQKAEQSPVQQAPIEKKRPNGTVLLVMGLAAAAVIGGVLAFNAYNSPAAQMNRALSGDQLELAYEIFDENFYPEDLSPKSMELLSAAAARVQENYVAGTVSYEDAIGALSVIENFACSDVQAALLSAREAIEHQYQIAAQLEYADTCLQDQEYTSAISAYEYVLSLDEANETAANGLEQAVDDYRDYVLTQSQQYASRGDFEGANSILLNAAEAYFQDDAEITAAMDALEEQKIQYAVEEIETAANGGDWDGALELLDDYQEQYPAEQTLQETREDIVKRMPITLKNLTLVSSEDIDIIRSVVTDRWGSVYDGAVKYDASGDAYGLYNLNKAYTAFTGTVFIPKESNRTGYSMSLAVYLDEELAYYREGITEETAPINLELDVTGKTTMRVVTDNSGTYSYGYLYFTNTNFAKAETQQS